MPKHNPKREALAKRFLGMMKEPDKTLCATIEDELPMLVEAELHGEDVALDPKFKTILEHIDSCPDCSMMRYFLTQEMQVFRDEPVAIPPMPPVRVGFPDPDRILERVAGQVVEIWERTKKQVRVKLSPLQLIPMGPATIGLFSENLADAPGQPSITINLKRTNNQPHLEVKIDQPKRRERWEVEVTIDDYFSKQTTNEQGLALFTDVPSDLHLKQVAVICRQESA